MISFARGVPAPECLAVEELADCARAALERDGRTILSYGPGGGYGPLREWLAERHGVEPGRIVITSGSLQGFVFLAEQLVRPGTRVLVEAPTYDRPLKILARLGAEVVTVPMDEEGLVPDELPEGDFAFLYTIPTFQNPSGRTMSEERRRRLAELAAERGLLVLEDDPYGLVRYEGEPLPSCSSSPAGAIAYCSSFSKTVAPGVRVGWFVLPARARRRARGARDLDLHLAAVPLAGDGARVPHARQLRAEPRARERPPARAARRDARRARARDARRRDVDAARRRLLRLARPSSGPPSAELLAKAEAAGVSFVKGSDFFPGGQGGERSLRLAFSFVSPEEIADGVSLLGGLVRAAAPAAL